MPKHTDIRKMIEDAVIVDNQTSFKHWIKGDQIIEVNMNLVEVVKSNNHGGTTLSFEYGVVGRSIDVDREV